MTTRHTRGQPNAWMQDDECRIKCIRMHPLKVTKKWMVKTQNVAILFFKMLPQLWTIQMIWWFFMIFQWSMVYCNDLWYPTPMVHGVYKPTFTSSQGGSREPLIQSRGFGTTKTSRCPSHCEKLRANDGPYTWLEMIFLAIRWCSTIIVNMLVNNMV